MRAKAAVVPVRIGDEDPSFAGCSHVVVQKYLHDLKAWTALTAESGIVLGPSERQA